MATMTGPTDGEDRGRQADVPIEGGGDDHPAVLWLETGPPSPRRSRDGLRTMLGWVAVAAGLAAAVWLMLAVVVGDVPTTDVDAAAVSGSDQRLHNLVADRPQ